MSQSRRRSVASSQCVAFQRLHSGLFISECCQTDQRNWSSIPPIQTDPTVRHCTRPPQHRSVRPNDQVKHHLLESSDQPSAHHMPTHASATQSLISRPTHSVQCNSSMVLGFLADIYGAFVQNLPTRLNEQMDLHQEAKRPASRAGGMPLKACDSLKVMLITMALCLTVSSSSCQTLYSTVIGKCGSSILC